MMTRLVSGMTSDRTARLVETDGVPPRKPKLRNASERTQALLTAPILPTLLRLAAPMIAFMVVQAVVSTGEVYYVGFLGADALAGVAVSYPLVMLMTTMSAGGMGGGIASAVARALGAGRTGEARRLVAHSLVIALAMGVIFTAGVLLGGRRLFLLLGAQGASLEMAWTYARIVFSGGVTFWLFNALASVFRGAGDTTRPASVGTVGAILILAVSPAFIFGLGPIPAFGIAGAAWAVVVYNTLCATVLAFWLARGDSPIRPVRDSFVLEVRLFWEVLRVGIPSSLNTIQINLTVLILTGLVGRFGPVSLAGYGAASRLEFLLTPLVFGLGSAMVPLVATCVGAGDIPRARRVTWFGAALASGTTALLGLVAAICPSLWMGLFSNDTEVVAAGSAYLRAVGPAYGAIGLGLALYFASQGAGRAVGPLLAGLSRLGLAAVGGLLVTRVMGGGLGAVYAVMAASLMAYGLAMAVVVLRGPLNQSIESLHNVIADHPRNG
jgi:putative MATE family efflux protein